MSEKTSPDKVLNLVRAEFQSIKIEKD